MRANVRQIIPAALLFLACATAQAEEIRQDTTWSGERTIDQEVVLAKGTLTIEPGTRITFAKEGSLRLGAGGVLVAKGDAQKPVIFQGEKTGAITGQGQALFEQCEFRGLGAPVQKDKPSRWFQATTAGEGIVLRHCRVTDCSSLAIDGAGPCQILACDFRDGRGDLRVIARSVRIEGNTLKGVSLDGGMADSAVVRDNVLVDGTIGGFAAFRMGQKEYSDSERKEAKAKVGNVLIEGNYVHRAKSQGSYCVVWVGGTIRGNLFRGACWTTGSIGGIITHNVLESVPAVDFKKLGGINDGGTHEHMCGLTPDTTVERNIFLHPSYGAIMGIGEKTCTGAIIRNNTFDMRAESDPIFLNHLPQNDPKGIVIRNNLFLRGRQVASERDIVDSVAFCDYNLWAPTYAKGRFALISMTGRKEGDEGFGRHDVPATSPANPTGSLKAEDVVQDVQFEFPYTDEDMLARKYSVAECIALYRKAYALKAGSPAIDAGDPRDGKTDPEVKDGRCDIGAIELGGSSASSPASMPASATGAR
jgi:hypothetical protein